MTFVVAPSVSSAVGESESAAEQPTHPPALDAHDHLTVSTAKMSSTQ